MVLTHGLDFAIFYACVLALFSYLLCWYVPIAARVVIAALRSWLKPATRPPEGRDDPRLWFDGHHSS
jgi:hypothetical protein